ncbi:LytR C-terminal domain-containing protein [Promicromonospora sp. NPDC050249]|uniref:LytR C-terminal domain-containing protein n=1 Tax=Promicromonospora sp. NPDC050249 TaxID=3154743 RepID=UPI0033D813C2
MTSPGLDQARVERRRREHERQAVVFGVLIAFLAVCGIFALAVYSGAISSPFNRPFNTVGVAEQETFPVPCLPAVEGQPDGALPIAYSSVQVRVLNASGEGPGGIGQTGLGGAYGNTLTERGFQVVDVTNADKNLTYSELRFGKGGIVAAYTLAAHFPDVRLVLDDRKNKDRTVDLLIGAEYEAPLDIADVGISADTPLTNAEGCVPSSEIDPQPRIGVRETTGDEPVTPAR